MTFALNMHVDNQTRILFLIQRLFLKYNCNVFVLEHVALSTVQSVYVTKYTLFFLFVTSVNFVFYY
jgi:hypothetical protein